MRVFGSRFGGGWAVMVLAAAALFFALASCPAVAAAGQQAGAATAPVTITAQPPLAITYVVRMPRPSTHLLEVEMRVESPAGSLPAALDLAMPVWTPGSYLVREYARHVQDFSAANAESSTNAPLAWRKVNKNTWHVATNGARSLRVRYRVYANELTVRTNELTDQHAFWNNAALLLHVSGRLDLPSTLQVEPPAGWRVATMLPPVASQPNTFRAADVDELYDAPVDVGTFSALTFPVRGVEHRIVLDGAGNYDAAVLTRDVAKIVEAAAGILGEPAGTLPYPNYTFLVHLRPAGGGGLEHRNGAALLYERDGFRPAERYQNFLSLVAHEYFHAWNVKRIRPDALGPFNYNDENYTRLLWVAEGITSYYSGRILRRAGLLAPNDYLAQLAGEIQSVQETPGRLRLSVEEASFDAWIKQYRPSENAVNSQISYYDKGALLGLLLDLMIRDRTENRRSLDNVLRTLNTDFAKRGRNYSPEDFQRVCEQVAGARLDTWFARYVRGTDELPYNDALKTIGLELRTTAETTDADGKTVPAMPKAFFGARLTLQGERLVVQAVPENTPAYDAGVSPGDQIVAVDGARTATVAAFNARVDDKKPGDTVSLTVFRQDDLRTLDVSLGGRVPPRYRLVPVKAPSARQKRLYQNWLGAPFPVPARQRSS